jgi:hypothetical protein
MKVGNLIKSAIIGASALALVGTAQAATININIYGASAQYKFWNDAADDFLLSKGAANIAQATDGKNGITKGEIGGDTIYIRYSAKASYDGIRAMQGTDPENENTCPSDYERMMADESQTDFGTGVVSGLGCYDVTIGASDVAATTFAQSSEGKKYGDLPVSPNPVVTYTMDSATIYDDGLVDYRPIVVPFGFFVNTANSLENMTRPMAVNLFSGKVTNWNQFCNGDTLPVKVCLRHAGSGTHATLDAAIMRGDATLLRKENASPFLGAVRYFYKGSSDIINGINNTAGAVGYADCDKIVGKEATWPNVKLISYQGVECSKCNITSCVYPFWSAQWLYEDPNEPNYSVTHPWVVDLADFASIAANVPAAKQPYWPTQTEMGSCVKENDFTLPHF